MSTSKNAKILIEAGRTVNDFAVMTDSGDQQTFTIAGGTVFSGRNGYTPEVRVNGVVTGRDMITPQAGVNDEISIAAFTANSKGVVQSVSAATKTISRPGTAGAYQVHSITMASDGSIAIVEGEANVGSFSTTRGAAGGPPLIPVEDVELGQIKTTASTAAVVTTDEIFQVPGDSTERADFPLYEVNNTGLGDSASVSAQKNAHLKFNAVLPTIHTGSLPKRVYLKYYTPTFIEQRGVDFVPAEKSHSVSSQQIYNETIASSSETLNAGGFTAYLNDGITDTLVLEKNQVLTVKHMPNRNLAPYSLTQGTIGLGRTYPVANQNQAAVTIAAERETAEFSS